MSSGIVERMRGRALVSVAFAVALPACSLLLDGDYVDSTPDVPAGNDAAATASEDVSVPLSDAGVDAVVDATPDAPTAPPNVFPNGSFEGPVDCNSFWAKGLVTATTVEDAHDGRFACKVCSTEGGQGVITAYEYYPVFQSAAAGETWEARAWMKSIGTGRTLEARLRFWNTPSTGETFLGQGVSGPQPIGTTWQEIVARGKTDVSADRVDPYWLSFPLAANECYVIDDIRVFRVVP